MHIHPTVPELLESLGLALFDRAANIDHRPLRDERRLAAFPNFPFRRARAPQGGIDVECMSEHAIGDTAPIAVEKVRGNDLEVVIRSVREGALKFFRSRSSFVQCPRTVHIKHQLDL